MCSLSPSSAVLYLQVLAIAASLSPHRSAWNAPLGPLSLRAWGVCLNSVNDAAVNELWIADFEVGLAPSDLSKRGRSYPPLPLHVQGARAPLKSLIVTKSVHYK
ncbi:hypothetical protein C8R44DRAFT_877724 [Mycena epipterygia]|nr:hypothetical protein C8R44DRAFT_877724 [Mycena epipterygia]